MNEDKLIKLISFILFVISVLILTVFSTYIRVINPNYNDTALFFLYWKEYILGAIITLITGYIAIIK